ncbi:hypothetical protein ALC56_05873 [Trachymyrmex septentrionalis]|uniref:RGS domain-containing protein n=1 Tax=Trachymyrmex septentrionalis TaxID=34720 RepID=A0A151JXV8_9HYME|nr:PREDICTED: uncharacterized protein LOC108748191 [Trachymyrmex septentrionalis]KYN39765.1 hypothetical protein ALC56_05873 [Trachymyrmex septentrionalis]
MSLPNQMFDCIKTNNLTKDELNRITDDVNKALIDPKGNELFESYLSQFNFLDGSVNLRLYNTCSKILNEKQRSSQSNLSGESLESLITKVKMIKETIEEEDITAIDFCVMTDLNKALEAENKEKLLGVLERIKEECQNNLRDLHQNFRRHILEK